MNSLEELATLDAHIRDRRGVRLTLAPDRAEAHALYDLARALTEGLPDEEVDAFAQGLGRVARAFVEDFPENVFWDFDRLANHLLEDPRGPGAPADEIVRLSSLYGRRSPICFRYIHDFVYGFDWCRWVAKAPLERAAIGPFEPEFLAYLEHRAGELVELIAADDEKYGRLPPPGAAGHRTSFRNPFAFSREPGDEERLHRALVERDLIPVRAWEIESPPHWDEPYAALRESIAESLHLPRRGGP